MFSLKLRPPELFSPVFVACCAALMSLESNRITGTSYSYAAAATAFSGALLAYSVAQFRFTSLPISGKPFQITGSGWHFFNAALSLTALLWLSSFMTPSQGIWLSLTALISFIYMFPVNTRFISIKPLRFILPLKNILVAAAWTLATVVIPLDIAITEIPDSAPLTLVMMRRFLFIFCLAVLYDLPDTESDRIIKVGSIPARFGAKTALVVSLVLLVGFQLLTMLDSNISPTTIAALTISTLYVVFLMQKAVTSAPRNSYRFMVDSAMMLQAVVVLAA